MSSEIDFKKLWQEQAPSEIPSAETIYKKADAMKKNMRNKLIGSIFLLLATMVFIIWVWFAYDMQLLTTKIGISLVVAAIVMSVVTSSRIAFLLHGKNEDHDNVQYLDQLLKFKKQQEFIHKKVLSVYFVLLSAGIALYMIEPVTRMSLLGKFLAYGITFAWILFNWFFLRPRAIRKQQEKINGVIEAIEKLKLQL